MAGRDGTGGGIGRRLEGMIPNERPEGEAALGFAGTVAPTEERPQGKAGLSPAGDAQEWPRGERGAGAAFIDCGVEREKSPRDAVVAEVVLHLPCDREQATVRGRGVAGLAGKVEGPDGNFLRV